MGKAVLRAGWWLLLPVSLLAQSNAGLYSTPKGELYTGYSFVQMEGNSMHGWNVSATGNVNRNLGIVGDFSGNYFSDKVTTGSIVTSTNLTFTSAMGGLRISDRSLRSFTPFVSALFGMTRVNGQTDVDRPGFPVSTTSNDVTGFATALGGGLDLNVHKGFFVRMVQADYFLIRANGFKHEGARVSAGIVWRFGQRPD